MAQETEESYDFDEPTPADTVYTTSEGTFIHRMGYPPIEVGGGSESEQFPDR